MSETERSLPVEDGPSIDLRVFLPSLIIVLIAGVYLVLAPDHAESEASAWMSLVTTNSDSWDGGSNKLRYYLKQEMRFHLKFKQSLNVLVIL